MTSPLRTWAPFRSVLTPLHPLHLCPSPPSPPLPLSPASALSVPSPPPSSLTPHPSLLLQVPSSWRPLIEDLSLIDLLHEVYAATTPPESAVAIDCLVRLASVRRSLFTGEAQRQRFVAALVQGSLKILKGSVGLGDHDNYHNFCRLLGRLKTNYQLNEIVGVECYQEWIGVVAQFTISSLKSWQWASSSVYYLLNLWSRLVSSVPYLKGDKPSQLDRYVPDIIEAFVTSRLESVAVVLAGHATEDPLESDDQLQEQMDSLPFLCRFQVTTTATPRAPGTACRSCF